MAGRTRSFSMAKVDHRCLVPAGLPVLLGFSVWILAGVLLLAVVLALPVAAIARVIADRRNGKPFTRRWLDVSVGLAFVLTIIVSKHDQAIVVLRNGVEIAAASPGSMTPTPARVGESAGQRLTILDAVTPTS